MSYFSDVERDLVVAARTTVADGVVAIDMVAPNGRDLPAWSPGSHVDVILRAREGALPVERQYSLCGDVSKRGTWRIAVLKEDAGRGGSARIHNELAVGERIRLRGPRNHFPFVVSAGATYRFVAGGIGITPILAMIKAVDEANVDWILDYSGRSRTTMAFLDELTEAHPDRVRVHAGDEGERLDIAGFAAEIAEDAVVFACGPARLIEALENALDGHPEESLHVERFEAKEFGEPVWSGSFEVELALSGDVVTVNPGESILDAIAEQSPETMVLSSCRRGTCGTCEVPILEGEVEHRDSILTPLEREQSVALMTCVSRAACERIVLDI
ncbi:PDR/VanB family oxidoreductase [Microbacterium sp. NPDC076911]|uniref:PDR/VanB family oxidoreductase n=1 Tax=Microbacterium sp. NPDC076911 TaxID=3154958 RepID=UPI003434E2F7